jgi:hypothetical protein
MVAQGSCLTDGQHDPTGHAKCGRVAPAGLAP